MTLDTTMQAEPGHNGEVPLYRQIEEDLLAQITAGQLSPGAMIPPERELCERYGVSRITVRRAIGELETRGYVRRQQGKGTFVSRSRIRREMGRLISFSEEMKAQGHTPGSRLLNLQHRPADKSVAALLHVPEGHPIWIVERLRLADDEVISLGTSYLNLPVHVYLTPLELNTEISLWSLLEKKGILIAEADTAVRAIVADARYAELLEVEEGDPLLVREGVNYSLSDEPVPIEAFEVVSRADRYQYSLHLVHHTYDRGAFKRE
ncbi:MAG TPA: GntR family transcriptional regulator [Anaerolineae bacterium]|nr:GntR family transcriptional regulator [Anaerolineae bacterium]